jgi:hypothetical protein
MQSFKGQHFDGRAFDLDEICSGFYLSIGMAGVPQVGTQILVRFFQRSCDVHFGAGDDRDPLRPVLVVLRQTHEWNVSLA